MTNSCINRGWLSCYSKSSEEAKRARKERLRALVGENVDLDKVPQLSCDPDGMVRFDNCSKGMSIICSL